MKARQLLRIRYDGDGLASKIAAIDQEVDVGRAGMVDEPVGERSGVSVLRDRWPSRSGAAVALREGLIRSRPVMASTRETRTFSPW